MDEELKAWGEKYAKDTGVSFSSLVSRLVAEFRVEVERSAVEDAEQI